MTTYDRLTSSKPIKIVRYDLVNRLEKYDADLVILQLGQSSINMKFLIKYCVDVTLKQ